MRDGSTIVAIKTLPGCVDHNLEKQLRHPLGTYFYPMYRAGEPEVTAANIVRDNAMSGTSSIMPHHDVSSRK